MFNTINAERYVTETIIGAMTGTAFVNHKYDDCLVITVPFHLDGVAYQMDVWEESDGSLYGEW